MGFSWKKALGFVAPVIAIAVPGIGTAVGAAILGSSAAATAAAVGLSVSAVTTAVGAAAISAGTTALQGGDVEDVLKAGLSAGVTSGVNFAVGGGVTGAVAGSAAGTAIQGGDASQVLTNAFAAGVGAGVQDAMPNNPDVGKTLGSAARTYIATGGNIDQTLLNTTVTAIGTLDKQTGAPIESRTAGGQQLDANTVLGTNVSGTGDDITNALVGMMSTQKPDISNIDDFKSLVSEELLKSQFDPVAGPAAGSSGARAIAIAEQSVLPAAIRFVASNPQLAAQAIQFLNQVQLWGAAGAAASLFLAPSDTRDLSVDEIRMLMKPIPPNELKISADNILKSEPSKVVSTYNPSQEPTSSTPATPPKTTTTPAKVTTTPAKITDTGDESARLLARFPPPGTVPSSDLSVMGGAEGDPIYTQLTAAINSGIDPYIAIAEMAGEARGYNEDPTSYLNDLVDAAAKQGLDAEKSVDAIVSTAVAPESRTKDEPIVGPVRPGAIPGEVPGIAPGVVPGVVTGAGAVPGVIPEAIPIPGTVVGTGAGTLAGTGAVSLPIVNTASGTLVGSPARPGEPPIGPGILSIIDPGLDFSIGPPNLDIGTGAKPNVGQPEGSSEPPEGSSEGPDSEPGTSVPPTDPSVLPTEPFVPPVAPPTSPEPLPGTEPPTELKPPPEYQSPPKPIYATVTQTPRPRKPIPPTIVGPSPARLLADALSAYRPAGAIEGAETGKERQNVWNEKSLRLKDALGL
jgi:hypothetical protein